MKIINKPLQWLRPYENNPRNNDKAVEPVANSIKEFGFKVPIVATRRRDYKRSYKIQGCKISRP